MSASQSNLSSAQYGYDFVVATTQGSINATMKEFLSGLTEPEVAICYIADSNGNPTLIDYDTLKKNADGSDPFNVPDGADPATNQDLKNLFAARFMVGFKVQIGLPPGILPQNIPDIVILGSDTSSVIYNLLCAEFNVVEYTPGGGYSPASWMNISQPPGAPWLFSSKVDLRLSTADQSAYTKLPPDVQAQIKNLGANSFSVQQLLFDLDNAALETIPTMSGVEPGTTLYTCLQTDFLGKYFSVIKQNGAPLLGCAVKQDNAPSSSLTLTDLNIEVSPYVDGSGKPVTSQQDFYTLNYLCAANHNQLPAAVSFQWNWLDSSETTDYDGVIAINRNTFGNYFLNKLQGYVSNNSYLSHVRVYLTGVLDTNTHYEWSLTPGQAATVTTPQTGSTVLSFAYTSTDSDEAGLNGDMGQMKLSSSFNLDVSFSGNTITVLQTLVIYLRVQSLQTSADGNVVDKKIIDTYTLAVDAQGKLAAVLNSLEIDYSKKPSTNGFLNFFSELNSVIDDIASWAQSFTQTNFSDIPISTLQGFVFPGGKTFAFKDAGFSDNQDLISRITYVDPS